MYCPLGLAVPLPGLLTVISEGSCRHARCRNRPPQGGITRAEPRAPPSDGLRHFPAGPVIARRTFVRTARQRLKGR